MKVTAEQIPMEITEEEAALYDRQIRLWGIDSQRKLRNARILLIGVTGLGAEVAKNIILAGVKSVTLLDNAVVSVDDSTAQFFAPVDALGQNRAEASVKRAQTLNPMVQVRADSEDVASKPDEYFGDFEVVLATGCPLAQLQRINTACRLRNVKFYCGQVFGTFGYFFADLLEHEFVEERVSVDKKVTTAVQMNKCYVPLVETLSVDWTQPDVAKRLRKMDPSYFLLLALHKFIRDEGRVPDRLQRDADIAKLKATVLDVLKTNSVDEGKVPDSLLGKLFGEVSPVSAIVGGVLAQDIIKCVSQKDITIDNYFFFNPERCIGFVEHITPTIASS